MLTHLLTTTCLVRSLPSCGGIPIVGGQCVLDFRIINALLLFSKSPHKDGQFSLASDIIEETLTPLVTFLSLSCMFSVLFFSPSLPPPPASLFLLPLVPLSLLPLLPSLCLLKVFPSTLDQEKMHGESPYNIMFGMSAMSVCLFICLTSLNHPLFPSLVLFSSPSFFFPLSPTLLLSSSLCSSFFP